MSTALLTRNEAADARIKELAESLHPIPPMTHPLSKHWSQPSRFDILVDDKHAVMDRATLEKLPDYSSSVPSGAYIGKMWRRRVNYHDESQGWRLCWMGHHDKPDTVSIHHRAILLA